MKIEIIKGAADNPVAEFFSSSSTPETDAKASVGLENADRECVPADFARILERERDEAREVLREMWASGDAFLPYIDRETTNRWRKVAGWGETK